MSHSFGKIRKERICMNRYKLQSQSQQMLFEKIIVDQSEKNLKLLAKQHKVIAKVVWRCNFCRDIRMSEKMIKKHVETCPKRNFFSPKIDLKKRRNLNVNGIATIKDAYKIIVSLSRPSKMPCLGYSISARRCITGSKLAKIKGTICSECYAFGGWYQKGLVKQILEKRADAIMKPDWIWGMIYSIKYFQCDLFRWHDSGDLQSVIHLGKIIFIATMCPDTLFWLPTREFGMVRRYIEDMHRKIPKNLKIILSATEFDKAAPYKLAKRLGVFVSEVSTKNYTCPAPDQGHKCLGCRKCWDKKVFKVVYQKHR